MKKEPCLVFLKVKQDVMLMYVALAYFVTYLVKLANKNKYQLQIKKKRIFNVNISKGHILKKLLKVWKQDTMLMVQDKKLNKYKVIGVQIFNTTNTCKDLFK